MKKDSNTVLYNIQESYFSIVEKYYGNYYAEYQKSNLEKNDYVTRYLSEHKCIDLLNGEDNLSVHRREFGAEVCNFWSEKHEEIKTCLRDYPNVGIFGSGDNLYPSCYENEIRQNALYYDMIILNDPFFVFHMNGTDYRYGMFVHSFYINVLTIMELKKYVLGKSKQLYVIIYPSDIEMDDDFKERAFTESAYRASSIAKKIFGLDYTREDSFANNIRILKELSDDEIQETLLSNHIYVNLVEAQNYEHNAMPQKTQEKFAKFMVEAWGGYNRDFIRCVLNHEIIRNIITTNNYVYKAHSAQAMKLGANPIFNFNEWEPFAYEVAGNSYPASDEFKYMCAIHRNDKMALMLQLSAEEIEKYRNKKNVETFRSFIKKAISSVHNTPENFEEIAESVFEKIDSMIDTECHNLSETRLKERAKAVWGFGKSVMGYIPFLSGVSNLFSYKDIGESAIELGSSLLDRQTIIEVIKNKNNK